jgi:hypothetical protein
MDLSPFSEPQAVTGVFRAAVSIAGHIGDFLNGTGGIESEPIQDLASHLQGTLPELSADRGELEGVRDQLLPLLESISQRYDLASDFDPAALPNMVTDALAIRDLLEQAFGVRITFAGEANREPSGTPIVQRFMRVEGSLTGLRAVGSVPPQVPIEQSGEYIGPNGHVTGMDFEEHR